VSFQELGIVPKRIDLLELIVDGEESPSGNVSLETAVLIPLIRMQSIVSTTGMKQLFTRTIVSHK